MNRGDTASRRGLAIALAALTSGLGVVMPVVDRVDVSPDPVAESEHTPGECLQGHDHLICSQVGANHAATVIRQETANAHTLIFAIGAQSLATPPQRTLPEGHPSRAPPRV